MKAQARSKTPVKAKIGPNNGNSDGSKTVRVTCSTADSLDLDKILPIQGDLKTLAEADFKKLRASILKYGISFPSYIWKNNGSASCIDGHQRNRVLSEMRKEGYKIPDVPVVYVEARDEKEAKEKILLLSSQYGKYSMDSVYEFLAASQIDFSQVKDIIDLPQFDLGKFDDFYFNNNVQPVSAEEQSRLDQRSPIKCPECGHEFIPE